MKIIPLRLPTLTKDIQGRLEDRDEDNQDEDNSLRSVGSLNDYKDLSQIFRVKR